MKSTVAILRPIPEPAREILKKKYIIRQNEINKVLTKAELKDFVFGADAILSILTDKVTSEIIEAAGPQLKIIANYAVGYDNIDVAAAKERNIVVTNTPGVLTEAVAEHAVGLMLATSRRIVESDRSMRKGEYHQWEPEGFLGPQIWGKTVGIIGLGRIGSWVAQILTGGFGMKVVYYDVERNPEFELRYKAIYHEVPALLKLADVVSVHVPLLPSTHHLISTHELKLMKNTAILVNTSRGPVVDEQALVRALQKHDIAGAGLDVYENEPMLTKGLAELPNVVLTSHIASATIEARGEMSRIAAENIDAVLSGHKPLNPVFTSK